jgi:hypothetical protein
VTQQLTNKNSIACLIQFLLVLILLTGSCEVASAQNDSTPPSTLITRFPFTTLSGGIIIIQLRLDDFPDTLNFILDTGSGGVSLDSTTVSYFRLPVTPSERRLRGIGSMRKISYVMNRTLHLPNLDVEHLDIHINDYELLTSVYGVRIDGIIGYSFLSRYIVKIDYDNNVVEVWNQGKIKYPKSGILLNPVISGIPVFDASIIDNNNTSSRFYFDTGAGLCLLMSEAFEQDSSILSKGKKIILTQAEGLGGKTQMKLTTVKQIKIGKYKFKKVPAHIFKDEYNVTAYPSLGGLIGNDLLRRFNLVLNYSEREIHLRPNSHFKESFDYSYTGLGIYVENNHVIIEDVLKDSPGEKAGLVPGDVIMGIDNNVSGNIQAYKNILQDVGAKIRILVVRNGELLVKHLKVASIL